MENNSDMICCCSLVGGEGSECNVNGKVFIWRSLDLYNKAFSRNSCYIYTINRTIKGHNHEWGGLHDSDDLYLGEHY